MARGGSALNPRAQTPVWARALAKLLFRVRFREGMRNRSFADGVPKREFGDEGEIDASPLPANNHRQEAGWQVEQVAEV
jgi:hypothetical protein